MLEDLCLFYILNDKVINVPNLASKSEMDKINKAIVSLDSKEEKLITLFTNDKINTKILNKKLDSLNKEKELLEIRKEKLDQVGLFKYEEDITTIFENKQNNNDNKNIKIIWDLLTRGTKKEILAKYIKQIELSIDEEYNITIEKVIFYNEFLQNDLFNFKDHLINQLTSKNKKIEIKEIITNEEFEKELKNIDYKKIYDYKDLVKSKNYELDNKMTELDKIRENNTLLVYGIKENNKIKEYKIVVI